MPVISIQSVYEMNMDILAQDGSNTDAHESKIYPLSFQGTETAKPSEDKWY